MPTESNRDIEVGVLIGPGNRVCAISVPGYERAVKFNRDTRKETSYTYEIRARTRVEIAHKVAHTSGTDDSAPAAQSAVDLVCITAVHALFFHANNTRQMNEFIEQF